MATFVKVTDTQGDTLIINLDQVKFFREREEGGCTVFFEKGETRALIESGADIVKLKAPKGK
ncbi:hypothetical protein [Bradyrhizobium japonicum]|uniref:hypothetical protein n=1 Tax=Bradyrhizobium japonicum TaxID=375 RepID=UPI000A1926B1|nr:hypothetical protein [Bradyrhizobium japonicum]